MDWTSAVGRPLELHEEPSRESRRAAPEPFPILRQAYRKARLTPKGQGDERPTRGVEVVAGNTSSAISNCCCELVPRRLGERVCRRRRRRLFLNNLEQSVPFTIRNMPATPLSDSARSFNSEGDRHDYAQHALIYSRIHHRGSRGVCARRPANAPRSAAAGVRRLRRRQRRRCLQRKAGGP
jgi:hypothetical protein